MGSNPARTTGELAQEQFEVGEKSAQEQTIAETKPLQEQALPEKTSTPKSRMTQQRKKRSGDAMQETSKPKKVPTARLAPQVEKRKHRSQGKPDDVVLPSTKRARGKSKSPQYVEGPRARGTQLDAHEEHSIRDPP